MSLRTDMSHSETLEFPLFKDYLGGSFVSSFSRQRLEKLTVIRDSQDLSAMQEEMAEALDFVKNSPLERMRDEDFVEVYKKLDDPLSFYEPQEMLTFSEFLKQARYVKATLHEWEAKHLKRYLSNIYALTRISDEIDDVVSEKGEIKDNASPKLSSIRSDLKKIKKDINKSLNSVIFSRDADKFVQETVVTERSGRFTIPCKGNFRQYIQGIVHDRSASGQTFFVEPSSTVQLNNSHHELMADERNEISRIIASIITEINRHSKEIRLTVENYTEVMFRLETALFYKERPHCFPSFGDRLRMKKVHHPIIFLEKGSESVPLDIEMEPGQNLGVVTGPNTGGKTAALKSLGLNHIIASCGLPLFGKEADMYETGDVLADIGDKQSLVMDLSTFSSHMVNIRDILEAAGSGSLVLMDELGTGTEPREGAALAVSICEMLLSRGVRVFVTTHFADMKNFALSRDDSAVFAVEFDYKEFEPRYSLLKGVAGKSDPILISRRLGFPDEVIKRSEEIIESQQDSIELGLEEVNTLRAELLRERESVRNRQLKVLEREAVIEERERELKKRLEKKESELLEEAYRLLEKGRRLAKEKPGKGKEKDIDADLEKAGGRLKKLESKKKPVRDIQEGDVIHLDKYDKTGKVLELDSNNAYIDMGGIRVKIKRSELVGKKIEQEEKIKDVKISGSASPEQRMELVLVGKRVEEGCDMLDKFLDDSVLSGRDKIYVVHGRGSGQLRKGLHEFMRNDPRVKSYQVAPQGEGGQAVTVVSL
ncbi:endonuclease MutS2 [Limisalsivibrio acetivorans]|uniref:endonuclease MutS2 n=1 Tax=Limisalsivibrio acetivorans TaxID=1304888 RepID=UPI0003B6F682|nr:Smr/MutS family protein [Limisalsivibrio acetivorans]